ncbi:hypothetical protein LQZ21_02180 [Treponema sp. TIM-1]|uniref:hypothetical protein n=1 Tax=Treponema sp. TIM-1 TaxID=2898417 RepID=UPI00397F9650
MKSIKTIVSCGLIALAVVITFAGCASTGGGAAVVTATGEDGQFTAIAIPGAYNDTLAAALDWIGANAKEGGAYTITVKADETSAPRQLSYDGKRVSITIQGDTADRAVSLSGKGALFAVENGVALILDNNLTLKGRGNRESAANERALVEVHSGGILQVKAGAVITDNYNADNGGGGVQIHENGTFTMMGGEIRGNTAKGGGGVSIYKGTFTLTGGTINGNTATEWGGGGVQVGENAVFTLTGGEIRGNTATEGSGGGVNVGNKGAFTLENGTISGNTADKGHGGGVSVGENATFTLKGGEVSGNTAKNGGGVNIHKDTFTMEGGAIRDNTATESGGGMSVGENATFTLKGGTISGNTTAKAGGGMNVVRGTFIMEGGEVRGNTAGGGGGIAVSGGTFIKKGGTIYGDTDKTHTAGSSENTATGGNGHAVLLEDGGKRRYADTGPEVKLYAQWESSARAWTYNDPAAGGVGDTAGAWEN